MKHLSLALGVFGALALGANSAQAQFKLTTPPNFVSDNGGSAGGIVYFDIKVTNTIRITDIETNYSETASTPVGVQVWVTNTATTYVGNEGNAAAWKQVGVDDGNAVAAGRDVATAIKLKSAVLLTPGSYGMALIAVSGSHAYTNGTGTNQTVSDANVALSLGAAYNTPWYASPFSPRVWNGSLIYTLGNGLFSNFDAAPTSGSSPLTVKFTDKTYTSSAGGVKTWAWDFDGDSKVDSTMQNPSYTYVAKGFDNKFSVTLTTTDGVNPSSSLTKKDLIVVNPSTAKTEDFGTGTFNKAAPAPIDVSPFSSIYSASTAIRGYHFVAPTTFVINGFEAPNDYTTPETDQTIVCYVLSTPPTAAFTATAADVKFFATGKANQILKPTAPITVKAGEWVGVFGACHASTAASLMRNSYGAGAFQSSVLGKPMTLERLWMNSDPRTSNGLGTVNPSTGTLARVFVHVVGNTSTAVPELTSSARPILGTTPNLQFNGNLPTAQGGILFLGSGRMASPVKTPFGTLLIQPPMSLSLVVPNGKADIPLPIPNDNNLKGVVLPWQGFVFDIVGGVWGMTNGTEWYVGTN